MPRIACLHTAESNVAVFEATLRIVGLADVELLHHVRADLLAAAERAGDLTPEVAGETTTILRGLCEGADAVLLTCSTLGPAGDAAAADAAVPIRRVDAALADQAVAGGGRVVVLCAVDTTVEPTRLLFEAAARETGAEVSVRLVPGAWAMFRAGNRDGYLETIAQAASEALRDGASRVALAQASMAGAADRVAFEGRVLGSPAAGLTAVAAAVSRGSNAGSG